MIAQISLGGFNIKLYGVIIAISIFAAWYLIRRRSQAYKIEPKIIDDMFLWVVLGGIVGARIYHVLSSWDYYQKNLNEIFFVWQGGLGIFGALLAGLLIIYIYCKKHKIDFLKFLDLISPAILLAQGIGRWGNFFNQEAFGMPTNLPWGIKIPLEQRPLVFLNYERFHPTFFYEFVWDAIGALVLIKLSPRLKKGQVFGLYLIIFGVGRLFVETLRFDTWQVTGVKVAYLFSVVFIIFGFKLLRSAHVKG